MFTDINEAISHARAMRLSHAGRHYALKQRKDGAIVVCKAGMINAPMWSTKNDLIHGENLPGAPRKLGSDDIPIILELWQYEGLTQAQIADKFDVARSTIENVVNNRTWKRAAA
ncbi:hypothetical protein [Serratia quinivorans]|uniref:hypothetical protein n=1 Tax=Serratia quinivorans TaxID=137545 RepID=UPI0034C5D714